MGDIVNWKFLESKLNQVKESAYERMDNLDNVDLSKMTDGSPSDSEQGEVDDQGEKAVEISVGKGEKDSGGPEVEVKVKNMKGRVKKINPHNYEVVIESSSQKPIKKNLNHIASGMYIDILNQHGVKKALECLLKDVEQNPQILSATKRGPLLTFNQARMVLSSVKASFGRIPASTADDVLKKTHHSHKSAVTKWLQRNP